MLTKSPIILPLSDQQTPAISPHYWYSQFVKPQLFPLPPPPGSLYRGTTECFTCTAILAQIPGISPELFLSRPILIIISGVVGALWGQLCEGKSTTVTHFYGCPPPPPTVPQDGPSKHSRTQDTCRKNNNFIEFKECNPHEGVLQYLKKEKKRSIIHSTHCFTPFPLLPV